jgi:plasmid maintenance system antidote protein VapI
MPPLHPGEMLREDFLNPLGMTAEMLAREIKVPSGGWLLS